MSAQSSAGFSPEGEMNIPELQRDLQRKYRSVGSKVEEIWRAFTPKQRATAMRETVGDGKVLKNSRDPGLGNLKAITPDWNLEDITSTPDFFLDRLRFRVQADLHRQHAEGANDGPGDREIILGAAQRRASHRKGEYAVFLDLGEQYGRYMKPNGVEGRRSLENMAAQSGLVVPANEAQFIIHRQTFTLIWYNHLIEEILDLDQESRVKKTTSRKTTKETTNALAKLTIQPKPLKASISDVVAQAVEHKAAAEDYLELLRSEPVVLNRAVQVAFYSRPELVPDDLGRILPMFADKYLSTAFFEVMDDAIKVIVTWDYIVRLLRLLDGLDDKVKRPLLMQELSNTCHLEYRRAQAAFRRQMSMQPGVGSKRFKRITTGNTSKIAIKGNPSDLTVADPQLHYILRLCHPDTSHKDAAQWVQKLDDHNTRHADDSQRLVENQVVALGDLAIIVSFMHTLSSSLASMPSGSKKSGLLFVGRTAELDAELSQYKAEADFGDQLVPMGNLLEPGVAGDALQALSEFVVSQSGATLGSLYEVMVEECLVDVEKKYSDAQARFEKAEEKQKAFVPLPTQEPKSVSYRVEQRREKAKTRPTEEAKAHDITAIAQPEPVAAPPPQIKTTASVAAVFDTIFAKGEARGSVSWADFAGAMADLGFSVTPKGGSIFTFNPPDSVAGGSITLHRPHISEIEGWKLLWLSRRLSRRYAWNVETFAVE